MVGHLQIIHLWQVGQLVWNQKVRRVSMQREQRRKVLLWRVVQVRLAYYQRVHLMELLLAWYQTIRLSKLRVAVCCQTSSAFGLSGG